MDFPTIGFIGLGAMGFPMAQRLVKQLPNTIFHLYDANASTLQRFVDHHAASPVAASRIHASNSAAEVTSSSDVILTMVPEGAHVREVYLDTSDGILAQYVGDKLLIDCSTIDPATTRKIAQLVTRRAATARFYDAPVSGGVVGAEKGTLTFMLGCTDDDPELPRLKALLGHMGGSIHACGGPGAGVTTKLCNNYLSGLIAIASSEAMNLGIRSGLDPRKLDAVFKTSTAQNAILDKFNPVPGVDPDALSSKDYEGGFKVQLMRKDFELAVQAAKNVGATLALGEAGLKVYEGASEDERCRDRDSRVVYRYLGGAEDWQERLKQEEERRRG